MKRILLAVMAVAAIACLSAAPALASQPSTVHPAAVAAAYPGHAVAAPDSALTGDCTTDTPCFLNDANGTSAFPVSGGPAAFATPVIGHVVIGKSTCWPFTDCGLDAQYIKKEVLEFQATNDGGYCMQTDSVHSGVSLQPCAAHDAGDYWVAVGNGSPYGACTNAFWLVNVGESNYYDPNIDAMFYNSADDGENVSSNLTISKVDQWCEN